MSVLELRSFLFGQSGERGADGEMLDYRLLSVSPPDARQDARALLERIDPLAQAWAASVTHQTFRVCVRVEKSESLRALLSSGGWAYVRLFPSAAKDSTGRVVRRYRVVALDDAELHALAGRPWRLDPFLPDGIDDGVEGRLPAWFFGAGARADAAASAGLELSEIELERLDPLAPLDEETLRAVERGLAFLERGWSVFLSEGRVGASRAQAVAGALLGCAVERADSFGVALSLPSTDAPAMRLLAANRVRVLTVNARVGRLPEQWVDLWSAPAPRPLAP